MRGQHRDRGRPGTPVKWKKITPATIGESIRASCCASEAVSFLVSTDRFVRFTNGNLFFDEVTNAAKSHLSSMAGHQACRKKQHQPTYFADTRGAKINQKKKFDTRACQKTTTTRPIENLEST